MRRRRPCLAILLGSGVLAAGAQAAMAETLMVPATAGPVEFAEVTSTTELEANRRYALIASGSVSNGGPAPGIDPLYCYANFCDNPPQVYGELRVKEAGTLGLGEGLDAFVGLSGKVPYSPDHRYAAMITGIDGRLTFTHSDAWRGSHADNAGAFQIEIVDLGPVKQPVTTRSYVWRIAANRRYAPPMSAAGFRRVQVRIGGRGGFAKVLRGERSIGARGNGLITVRLVSERCVDATCARTVRRGQRIVLRPDGGGLFDGPRGGGRLGLRAIVERSDLPGCESGRPAAITVHANPAGTDAVMATVCSLRLRFDDRSPQVTDRAFASLERR